MPNYDYECPSCGPFSASRPMAQYDQPHECPTCGTASPRAFFHMPSIAGMEASTRTAFATNEKAQHEPKRSKDHVHGPGCGCGSKKTAKQSRTLHRPDGSKSFPTARPWQISH